MNLLLTSTMFLLKNWKTCELLGKQANSFSATEKSINYFVRKFEWIFSLKNNLCTNKNHHSYRLLWSNKWQRKTLFFCCTIRTCLSKNYEKNNAASIIDIKSSFKSVWFRCYVFDYFVLLYFKLPDRGPKWLVRHLVSKLEHLIL